MIHYFICPKCQKNCKSHTYEDRQYVYCNCGELVIIELKHEYPRVFKHHFSIKIPVKIAAYKGFYASLVQE